MTSLKGPYNCSKRDTRLNISFLPTVSAAGRGCPPPPGHDTATLVVWNAEYGDKTMEVIYFVISSSCKLLFEHWSVRFSDELYLAELLSRKVILCDVVVPSHR
jgi:hypothetical protein